MVCVVIENGVIEIIQRRRPVQKLSKTSIFGPIDVFEVTSTKIDVNYDHSDHFAPQLRPKIVKTNQNVSKIIKIGIIAENHEFGPPYLVAESGQ